MSQIIDPKGPRSDQLLAKPKSWGKKKTLLEDQVRLHIKHHEKVAVVRINKNFFGQITQY
jgi:hypothetical protein